MTDENEYPVEDTKAKKTKAEKVEATSAPETPVPTQEEADAIKEGETRDLKAQTTTAGYKTR